jgi:hypothetical protein
MADRLPDGWGPDSPVDDTLARAYAESWATLTEDLGKAGGHATKRTPDFVAYDSHQPFPFVNPSVLLRPVLDAADPLLDEVSEFFAPDDDNTPFLVLSATPLPSLAERGWHLMGHPPLMLRPAGPADVPAPEGLEIVEVRDADALAEFDRTMIDAYPVPAMQGRTQFSAGVLDAPGWRMWLGYVDGTPVATAAAHVMDAFVDVEWISTRADYRGRRIGEAMTWQATLAAPDRPAMLFASDDGQPVYERMGYLRLSRLTLWIGTRGAAPVR